MSEINIKPTHKAIETYYTELEKYEQLGEENEGTVRAAFQNLLQYYCHQSDFTLLCDAYQEVNISARGSLQIQRNGVETQRKVGSTHQNGMNALWHSPGAALWCIRVYFSVSCVSARNSHKNQG